MYHIERERFLQMYDDIESAMKHLEKGNRSSALYHLQTCKIMMMTENDFYGKELPLESFGLNQEVITA